MSPTKIVLKIFSKEFLVISYFIGFSQNFNLSTGKIVGDTVGNLLEVSIESDGKTDFIEWMIKTDSVKEGKIEFFNGKRKIKTISFSKAALVGYNQNLDDYKDLNGQTKRVVSEDLSISYQTIKFDAVTFNKNKKSA